MTLRVLNPSFWILCFRTLVGPGAPLPAFDRPNFLIIITDDQSPLTLGAYGNEVCHTPHIDRVAGEGLLLRDAHHMGSWSGAVCLPSRTMLMTGRTLWSIPGYRNRPPPQQKQQDFPRAAQNSLPAVLNAAGYHTFRTCKQGNSFAEANALFQVRREATKRGGKAATGSAWHADQALEFLESRVVDEREDPFLIYLGFSHPHDPRDGPPELLQKYGAVPATDPPSRADPSAPPLPRSYLPAHPFPHGHPNVRDETQVQGVLAFRTEAVIRNELGREYACIENIDRQVGRVLQKLESIGDLENTYVFFTSDHGISLGRHGLLGKQNLYEHTWCVPFLVRGPGIKPGTTAAGNVYLLDLLPTICDLAGIALPPTVQGTSMRLVLEGKTSQVRDALYGCYCGGTRPGIRCIKKDGWKLIKYDVLDGTVRRTQMFNLQQNPDELLIEHHSPAVVALTGNTPRPYQVSLAEDPRYAAKRQELEALLLTEQKRLGDPFRLR